MVVEVNTPEEDITILTAVDLPIVEEGKAAAVAAADVVDLVTSHSGPTRRLYPKDQSI